MVYKINTFDTFFSIQVIAMASFTVTEAESLSDEEEIDVLSWRFLCHQTFFIQIIYMVHWKE